MNLQLNHFKTVLLFLVILAQCGLAAAMNPYQSQKGQISTPDSPEQTKSAPATGLDTPAEKTASLAASLSGNRLAQLDDGIISGSTYTNRALGFSTGFPAVWQIIDAAKQHGLIEANHKAAFGDNPAAQDEHEMVWRCNHILLWSSQNPENHLFIVSVWDPSCFPEVQFPASSQDRDGIQHLIESMRRPPFGGGDYIIEPDEELTTLALHGHLALDISAAISSGESTTYMSLVMAPLKEYWVCWMLMAPSRDALQELKNSVSSSAKFDVP